MRKLVIILSLFGLIFTGCASIQPMSNDAVRKYALSSNAERFKDFQYYISRDIVLSHVYHEAHTSAVGQISIHHDIVQVLSSTRGVVIDVARDERGNIMLGVAFEKNDDDLLWFVQNPDAPGALFHLVYNDQAREEVMYRGNPYTISYDPTGAKPVFARMNPFKRVKRGQYDGIEPILLYSEVVRESENRRNLPGRRL